MLFESKRPSLLLPEQKILVVGRGSTELEQVLQGTHLKSAELNPDDIQNIIKTDSGANHVSRVHLAITRREGQLVAWDLDSSFGTMDHNKQPFIHAGNSSAEKPVPLMPGQILWLGGVVALQLPKAI